MSAKGLEPSALFLWGALLCARLPAADCNGNGRDDAQDISLGLSPDCNANAVPDECDLAPRIFAFNEPLQALLVDFPPGAFAGADLDEDGDLDLVASLRLDPPESWILWNGGDGRFTARTTFPLRIVNDSRLIIVADLAGDRRVDIARVDPVSNRIEVYRSSGERRFEADAPIPLASRPAAVVPVDLDGDGIVELVSLGTSSEGVAAPVQVLRRGDGPSFGEKQTLAVEAAEATDVAVLDMNADSIPDIVVGLWKRGFAGGALAVLKNRADGTGTLGDAQIVDLPDVPLRLAPADLDGDSTLDLAAATKSPTGLLLLSGRSNGGFAKVESIHSDFEPEVERVMPGDVDGDADVDLIVVHSAGLRLLVNERGGFRESELIHPHAPLYGVDFADFGGVGKPELVTYREFPPAILLSRGRFIPLEKDCDQNSVPDSCDAANSDCNGDRIPDACELNPVEAAFAAKQELRLPASPSRTSLVDLDGDRDLDLLGTDPNAAFAFVSLNDGSGRFAPPSRIEAPTGVSDHVTGDFTGDGRLDLAAVHPGGLSLYLGAARGSFELTQFLPEQARASPSVAAGDIDGDGDLDLCALYPGDTARRMRLYRNDGGAGLVALKPLLSVDSNASPGALRVVLADLDEDGHLDIVRTSDDGRPAMWRPGLGDTRFETARELPARYTYPGFLIVRDLDSNGSPDLIFTRGSAISVLENQGRAQLFESRELEWGLYGVPTVLEIGDFDGNGRLDLAAALPREIRCSRKNLLFPAVGVWKQGLKGELTGPGVGVDLPDTSWTKALVAGDLDGDGRDELIAIEEPMECARIPGEVCPAGLVVLSSEVHAVERDCNRNGRLDECEPDCNANQVPDDCDLAQGAADCNLNGLLDACEASCNSDGVPDDCEIASGRSPDCNHNGVPDACDVRGRDANENGVPDDCDLADGTAVDCNRNGVMDEVELARELAFGVPRSEPSLEPPPVQAFLFHDVDGDSHLDRIVLESGLKEWDEDSGLGFCISSPARLITEWNEGGRFVRGPEVRLGYRAAHVAELADLDADGLPELVISETSLDPVGVITGQDAPSLIVMQLGANGYAQESTRVPLESEGFPLATGDFDGDGDLDLAIGSSSPQDNGGNAVINLFLNDGRSGLIPGPVVKPHGFWNVLATGDCDGDKRADLVLGAIGSPGYPIRILYADTGGSFSSQIELGEERELNSLRAADLNGDSQADLIAVFRGFQGKFSDRMAGVEIIQSDGRGRLLRKGVIDFGIPVLRGEPLMADLDEDGDMDFTAFGYFEDSGSHAAVSIARNDGKGALAAPEVHSTVDLRRLVAFGNFAGSLDPDLLFETAIVEGRGRGQLDWPSYLETQQLAADGEARSLAALDLNGDGRADFAAALSTGVSLLRSRPQGPYAAELLPNGSSPQLIFTNDIDGDGDADLLTTNEPVGDFPSTLSVYLNVGGGRISAHRNFAIGGVVTDALLADLDQDGDQDLVAAEWTSRSITALRNLGQGAFSPPEELGTSENLILGLASGDVDGDQDLDLIAAETGFLSLDNEPSYCNVSNRQHRLVVLENKAGNKFEALESTEWRPGRPAAIAAIDLDGNGELQATLSIRVCRFDNDADDYRYVPGGGIYRRNSMGLWSFTELEYAQRWLPADLDGDGDLDLPYRLGVLRQGHDGRFERFALAGWQTESALTTLGDADGDNDLDLAYVEGDELRVIENRSAARGLDRDHDGIPDDCLPASVVRFTRGDANQDGKIDIADPVAILGALFKGGAQPACADSADANDDGALNVTDAITLLARLFLGGAPLAEPGACGGDRTPDGLGCAAFGQCG